MDTKTKLSLAKYLKVSVLILPFLALACVSAAFVLMLFFFLVFILIFRSNIKYKEKTGSWPTYTSSTGSWSPSPQIGSREWDMNPLNPGSPAWHASQTIKH